MKPAFQKVSEAKSEPYPVNDGWADHNGFTRGECPTSDHSKRVHRARADMRQTVTITWGDGRRSKSYIDHCKCRFCGHKWKQEWMPA